MLTRTLKNTFLSVIVLVLLVPLTGCATPQANASAHASVRQVTTSPDPGFREVEARAPIYEDPPVSSIGPDAGWPSADLYGGEQRDLYEVRDHMVQKGWPKELIHGHYSTQYSKKEVKVVISGDPSNYAIVQRIGATWCESQQATIDGLCARYRPAQVQYASRAQRGSGSAVDMSRFEAGGCENCDEDGDVQPPPGFRTIRKEIGTVGAFTVAYWGNFRKVAAVQKWICFGEVHYNLIFECEEDARAFLNNRDRAAIAADLKAYIDGQPQKNDPSAKQPGSATQAYKKLKKVPSNVTAGLRF